MILYKIFRHHFFFGERAKKWREVWREEIFCPRAGSEAPPLCPSGQSQAEKFPFLLFKRKNRHA